MDRDSDAFTAADYGLTDPEILLATTRMVPTLFLALRIAHTLAPSHFPLESATALEHALASVADDGDDQITVAGLKITRKAARERFPTELLPIVDKHDLLRKIYLAVLIRHKEAARHDWTNAHATPDTLKASHPLPKEVL